MIKRLLVIGICLVLVICNLVFALGGPAPTRSISIKPGELLLEDFEDGNFVANPEWWVFDQIKPAVVDNGSYKQGDAQVISELGRYSLLIQGSSKGDWYAGGMGSYIAKERQDLSGYNAFQIDVYGNGPGSGTIKVELIDDDNGNWQVEQDPAQSYIPIKDDRFVSEIRIDWKGWKRINIPFTDFIDDNPKMGDDKWNPKQIGASGGLLQFQLVCIAGSRTGTLKFNIANLKLVK